MKLLNYLLSAIYGLYFLLMLCIFHVIQVFAYNILDGNLFGKPKPANLNKYHRISVDWLNFFLLHGLYLVGSRLSYTETNPIPTDRPLVFVANHQSMYDIIGLIWYLRKYRPVFVSKKELAKGVPSISYNLQKSGAANIDRKDGKKAVMEIARLGKFIEDTHFSAVIFPEGTRSRKDMREFQTGGVATLLKRSPSAWIVPVVIDGTGTMDAFKVYPIRCFQKLTWKTLEPLNPQNFDNVEAILNEAKRQIAQKLTHLEAV